ncbi:Oxidored-FMN domain-containing protein [Mycena indigotica]|uniref:Oxidored-FMN domain-containing protein n=1 Tax=Mycena indigotica TaxID=2126181 RepID=A0A8H6SAF4_9AGAR|nr:Oxidored-FMN domain-containing protein [Mycena indigotica]KAF7294732.1 Oxidored-FMN domain-containing protein [Mycena indigotica]
MTDVRNRFGPQWASIVCYKGLVQSNVCPTSTMSSLFTPLKLGSITISNRIGMSALTRNRSSATVPNEVMLEYYFQRAKGGAGFIISEGTLITRQGTEWQAAPGVWNDAQVAGWKKITNAVHGAGSKMYCQVWHLGRVSHPDAPEQIAAGEPVYAPSAISARGGKFRFLPGKPGYVKPTELPDPTVIIEQFKQAAIHAKEAGFDGVELHGANGYIVHQFLDSSSNQRTDKWGGSPENRARFALETLKALIEVYGPDVSIKLSPEQAGGYNDMGMPLQETIDTYGCLLSEADKLGLAYVTLVRYAESTDVEYDGKKRATKHDVVGTFKPFLKNTPLFVNAGVTPEEAEELVSNGTAAGVFFGLPMVTHPDVGNRIRQGKPLDNAPDFVHLYGAEGVDPAIGYVDYPAATST